MNKNKKIFFLILSALILPFAFLLSACGQTAKAKRILVSLAESQYVCADNQIIVEWGEKIDLDVSDFNVTLEFEDGTSENISGQTDKFSYTSNLPVQDSELEDGKTPIGTYQLSFSYEGLESKTITINVVQKRVELDNLIWTDYSNFVYDGNQKTVQITSQLPSYVSVEYQDNAKIDAGEYNAIATFTCIDNHYQLVNSDAHYGWSIQKASYNQQDLNAIALQNSIFVYDGSYHQVALNDATIPAGLEALIVNGGSAVNAGNYVAEVELTPSNNYNKPNNVFLNWNIQKANIDVSNVALVQNSFDYNGEQTSVALDQNTIPQGCSAQIIAGGVGTAQGTYHAVVEFTLTDVNYNKPDNITLDWEIAKRTACFASAPTANEYLHYTGSPQELLYEGVVNGGVAQYIVKSFNGEALASAYSTQIPTMTNAGTYVVGYKIVGDEYHYDLPEQELSVTIAKANVPTYNLLLNNSQSTYTGSEIVVEINSESIPACVEAQIISGGNAVNAGNYKAVVEFTLLDTQNYNVPQNLELDWQILPARLDVMALVKGSQVVLGNDAETDVNFNGFLGTDTAETVLSGEPVYDLGGYNKQASKVGDEYTVTVSGYTSNGNYEIVYIETEFTVLKANVQTIINGITKYENSLPEIRQSGTYKLLDNYEILNLTVGDYEHSNLIVILDLGGHTLSSTSEDISAVIYFDDLSSGNTLTIQNGTIDALTHNVAVYAKGENILNLEGNLTILAHNGTALSVDTENVVVNCAANIQAPYAISFYDGELNILGGEYDGSVSIHSENVTISDGVFKQVFDVSVAITQFITGGKFTQYISSDYIGKFYEIQNQFYQGMYYNVVVLRPEILDVNILQPYYIQNVDESFDEYEIEVTTSDYIQTTILSEYSDYIEINTDGVIEDGKIELIITIHRFNKDDLVKTAKLNVVTVENVHFIMDGKHDFVADATNLYDYCVEVLLSNGDKYEVYLADCMSQEDLDEFISNTHSAGETYTFKLSYGGWSQNIDYVFKGLEIIDVAFSSPRQCIEFGGMYWEIQVKYNSGEVYNYSITDENYIQIVSINEEVDGRPAIASVEDIDHQGTYTFVIKIRLGEEYNSATEEYEPVFSSEYSIQIAFVSEDEVMYFQLENEDIIAGSKPQFYYSTFNNQNYSQQDIYDDMTIVDGEFDYTTPGIYNVTFSYHNVLLECTINVHAPDEARYAYLVNSTYIIGKETQIELFINTWDETYDHKVPFLFEYITSGTIDLTTRGQYNFKFAYAGLTDLSGTINVVNLTDANYIYFEDTEYEIDSKYPIVFRVSYYNNESEYITLTRDMLISGDFPDITTVGEYTFNLCYANYTPWSDVTITIYDPQDTTIVGYEQMFNYRLVWTYSVSGENVIINDSLDGLFIKVTRANGQKEILPVTAEMFGFDRAQAIANIQNDYYMVSYQFNYLDKNSFGVIDLVAEEDLDDYLSSCELNLILNGENLFGDIRINIDKEITSFYGCYKNGESAYYMPLTLEDVLNADTNQIQDLTQSGVYNVSIMGQNFVWCVYDINDADIYGYLKTDVSVMENSSVEDLINILDGKKLNINYSFKYQFNSEDYSFTEFETIRLLASDFENSDIDLSKIGNVYIKILHNGIEIAFKIIVYPNVEGQEKHTYALDMGYGISYVDVYDEYCSMNNYWYKYRVVDEDFHVVAIEIESLFEMLYVFDDNEMTLTPFVTTSLGVDPVVYTTYLQGEYTEFKVYNQKFVDVYQYKDSVLELQTTMTCQIIAEGDEEYFIIMGMKFKIEEDKSLTIPVAGEIVYEYYSAELQIRAEFRDNEGEQLMYYYQVDGEDEELAGTLTWVLDTENSVINCYSGDNLVVQFTVDLSTNKITGMQMNA